MVRRRLERECEEAAIGRLSKGFGLSLLLHFAIVGLILWLMMETKVTPKAINRQKITLELSQIQTLPPKPPGARPTPRVPPTPKPTPNPTPPRPNPKPVPKPHTPKPVTRPQKKLPPKETQQKISKGIDHKNPLVAERNSTRKKSDTNDTQKVIVMKMVEKKKAPKKPEKPPKPQKPIRKKPTPPKKVAKATPPRKASPPRKKIPPKKHRRRPPSRPTPRGPDSRLIRSLYGSSYSRMSATQRRFIDENLRKILEISQRTLNYLGYPREAARFGEQGTNIVEFWLHPNGDISSLRLKRRLNSRSLNRQTLEVIRTAYMYYPRPKVKTKIIIYVRYRLY